MYKKKALNDFYTLILFNCPHILDEKMKDLTIQLTYSASQYQKDSLVNKKTSTIDYWEQHSSITPVLLIPEQIVDCLLHKSLLCQSSFC